MDCTLKNIGGIDCIFVPMDWSHYITTRVWVKAGSDYESDKEWGISHYLEHLAFNGGKKWKTGQELKDFVKDIGGGINGSTGDYRTNYYVNTPCEYRENNIEILGDMLVDALYLDKENESEKDVIIQEIKMRQDDNKEQAYRQGRRFFMGDCSYSRDALGTKENVMGFSKDDFLSYKQSLYTKDNMVIVVAGRIDNQNGLEKQIGETFGKLPDKKSRELPLFERNFPSEHEKFIEKGINQPRVAMFIPGKSCISEKSIACNILAEIINRRLYQRIREELGLCYEIRAVHINQMNYGFFLIEAGLQNDKLSFGLEKINEVIDDLLKNGATEKEFNSVINGKRGTMLIDYETPVKVADFVANNYITLDKIVFPENRAEEFSKVEMKEVENLLPLLGKNSRYTFYIK